MTFTGCIVSYVGIGQFALTAEESAIVDVVAEAGGDVSDRERTFLLVLTASTRVDPSTALSELSRSSVGRSSPDRWRSHRKHRRPALFADWLAATA